MKKQTATLALVLACALNASAFATSHSTAAGAKQADQHEQVAKFKKAKKAKSAKA